MTRAFTSIAFDRPPHPPDRPGRSLLVILSTIVVLCSAIGGYLSERPGAASGALSVHTDYYQNGPGAFVPGWTNITPTAGGDDAFPQARQQPGMTYDTGLDGIILYGGTGGSGQILNDTWLQVSGELEWNTPIFAPTVHEFPPGLSHTALAYDPQDEQLILFGGDLASGSAYGGTWGFAGDSWVNFTWTNFTSPTGPGPGPVATPAMAFDPAVNGILLYTGSNGSSTWLFQNGTWSSVAVASAPPARSDGAIVYDPYEGGVVLFGGQSKGATSTFLNDTWLFKNGAWTQLALAHAPPPLFSPSLTYDTRMGAALLVGGGSSVQTWAFTNGTWSNQSSISTLTPSGRTGFGIAYDAGDDWVMLFGGDHWTGWPPILDDIWGWDYPATAPNDQLVAEALPTQIWEIAAFVVAVPIILAILWVFWPRRRLPADSPFGVPSRARSRRAPVPEPPS